MARLATQLREKVGIDPVTGFDTRSRFEERMTQEVKRGARHGHRTTVVVVEVRPLAGTPRLPTGRLLETGEDLRDAFRDIDTVARIGESRFAALLPGCDATCAARAVHRVIGRLGRRRDLGAVAGHASTGEVMGWELLEAAELAVEDALAEIAEAV